MDIGVGGNETAEDVLRVCLFSLCLKNFFYAVSRIFIPTVTG